MVGTEYAVDEDNICEPHLYVIKKQRRESPRKTFLLEIFYVLDGIIFQSPDLLDLLRSRICKTSYYLKSSFEQIHSTLTFSPDGCKCLQPAELVATAEGSNAIKPIERRRYTQNIREFPSFDSVVNDLSAF
jgi:hypothetical protein